jgi:N-acetylmuramic acid 6-phosphate (MurNAc-6-P) etherase
MAIRNKRKVYFYGCGATGRLALQMESALWRSFWQYFRSKAVNFQNIKDSVFEGIENVLEGEMTGGDKALISSLEGLEDLEVIGARQLEDHNIAKGDVVVCVTEGGETSSVIGTIMKAHSQWSDNAESKSDQSQQSTSQIPSDYLYFVYNNPDSVLMPFNRSRKVLECKGITKINLATGPQAISGSTRMQATTSELFCLSSAVHVAIFHILQDYCSVEELKHVGFNLSSCVDADRKYTPCAKADKKACSCMQDTLYLFDKTRETVLASALDISKLSTMEATTYSSGQRCTYLALSSVFTVFTDSTERSPTFRLLPLDQYPWEAASDNNAKSGSSSGDSNGNNCKINCQSSSGVINDSFSTLDRQCLLRVWTQQPTPEEAWKELLHRNFRGLKKDFYIEQFTALEDPFLKGKALDSLDRASNKEQYLYNFAYGEKPRDNVSLQRRIDACKKYKAESSYDAFAFRPHAELSICVLLGDEVQHQLTSSTSVVKTFIQDFHDQNIVLIAISPIDKQSILSLLDTVPGWNPKAENGTDRAKEATQDGKVVQSCRHVVCIPIHSAGDPMGICQTIAAKTLLNAHSTAVMAMLGKVVGNTMTNVSPSNLKLVGRATNIVDMHTRNKLQHFPNIDKSKTVISKIAYHELNALLYESIEFTKQLKLKIESQAYVQPLLNEKQSSKSTSHTSTPPANIGASTAEVPLTIIRILEACKTQSAVSCQQAFDILATGDLDSYLANFAE